MGRSPTRSRSIFSSSRSVFPATLGKNPGTLRGSLGVALGTPSAPTCGSSVPAFFTVSYTYARLVTQSQRFIFIFHCKQIYLSPSAARRPNSPCQNSGVERLTRNDRASAVAAAAAHDINEEMTIILNSASASIDLLAPGHT